jgi:hypothetical protein
MSRLNQSHFPFENLLNGVNNLKKFFERSEKLTFINNYGFLKVNQTTCIIERVLRLLKNLDPF